MRNVQRLRPRRSVARRASRRGVQPADPANRITYRPSEPQIPRDNHPNPLVSVIIPAMNEAGKIGAVIAEARAVHPETEVIVVANGCKDQTASVAERMGAKVLSFAEPLGNDVGRSVGAQAAKGRILLFTDSDMVIPSGELRPFVQAVLSGVDVALNDYTGPVDRSPVHRVILAKYTLNTILGRSDLRGASLTAVPHALSRRALDVMGARELSIPPKAQAAAMSRGLRVEAVYRVEVGRLNPGRTTGGDPLEMLVLGDHLEALEAVIAERGVRGGYHDGGRRRSLVR
ncbi:glycosyltransferase [Paenibacillus sp. Cedars]|uniref:glycosyltransferase family 2 protein n=1 Tax=Paenibacillus sp. Cedars TaxID=1980674 RepID=UPI001162DE5B|nr:glycosyltransferase [Paenibacillus sp. Cedars]AWP29188.1 glycosyl transferase [Paenibacillus sp. Cedars]